MTRAPVTIHASPRARHDSSTPRAPMNTTVIATHTATSPCGSVAAHSAAGAYAASTTSPAQARNFPSPAPMSTPSSTKTTPASGWPIAATSSTGTRRSWTAGSLVKSAPTNGETAASASPATSPLPQPQRIIRRVSRRVVSTSPLPSARPVRAWAAIAMASSAKARKVQRVIATWWVATVTSRPSVPTRATAYVPTSRHARRARVRITRATAACAAARMPGRSGVRGAPCSREARTTTATSHPAETTWAITEPIAEPAMPRSRP